MSSTDRSPCASTSTISARRPLAKALATSANPSYSASLAARSPTPIIVRPLTSKVKSSNDYLTIADPGQNMLCDVGYVGGGVMATRLAAKEIAVLDPYKFMAVIGKRVIHPGGRSSTESLLRRAQITDTTRVLDVGCGVATTAVEIAKRYGAQVTAVDISPVMLERATANTS